MRRVVFLMLAVFIISISMYGDIGKGNWTQDEINYFSNKEYKGNCTMYEFARKWVPPYVLPDLTEIEFMGFGSNEQESISKLILIGKLNEDTEFRYLSLLRNEIYARNGYIFKDRILQEFFNHMPWYSSISEDVQLNRHEKRNVKKIKELECKVRAIVAIKEPNPDTLSEKYIKKVILKAKWGDGEGEFALAGESPVYGPEPMIIDKEDNIYIADQGNARIAKYNDKGELERYFNYCNYTDYQNKTVKWAIGGNLVAIQDNILYTNLYYYKKYSIISFNVITGEIIEKVNYNSIKYHKELTNMIFYDTNEKYKIGETGEFKSLKERKEDSVVNIIEENYPRKLGTNYFISYLGLDSLKNKYYEAYITRIRSTIGSDYICLYKFSKDNKLLAYIGYPLKDYLASEGTIIHITPNGDIYFLYPSGKVFIKDWKQKFIPGKIQLIKWELQK